MKISSSSELDALSSRPRAIVYKSFREHQIRRKYVKSNEEVAMNCDLILTENSCRLCLGEAQDGNLININTHFLVEKRLVDCLQIFKFLDIKVWLKTIINCLFHMSCLLDPR